MLSPRMYEDYVLGPQRRLTEGIRGPTILHICGDITPRLDALFKTGIDCFNFDWAIEPRVMKKAAAGKFSLMGNVNTLDLLKATPDVIETQVQKCLEAEVDIISPGCAVSPECPVANFQAMVKAVEDSETRGIR